MTNTLLLGASQLHRNRNKPTEIYLFLAYEYVQVHAITHFSGFSGSVLFFRRIQHVYNNRIKLIQGNFSIVNDIIWVTLAIHREMALIKYFGEYDQHTSRSHTTKNENKS